MQYSPYQRAEAEDTLSNSGCRRLSIRQRMQESLYKTGNAGESLSEADAGDSIRQQMQEFLSKTVDVGDSLTVSRCRSLSIRQRMQETLYQTSDAGVSLSDSG